MKTIPRIYLKCGNSNWDVYMLTIQNTYLLNYFLVELWVVYAACVISSWIHMYRRAMLSLLTTLEPDLFQQMMC